MTESQEAHLNSIVEAFTEACIVKYRKGAEEHGGDLFSMPFEALLDNAIDEAIDQFVYLMTMKQQLKEKYVMLPPVED